MNKEIRDLLRHRTAALESSTQDMESIYHLTFENRDYIMTEHSDGYRIYTQTYGEVFDRCEAVAAALYERIGERHDYIGIEMDNSTDWIAAFWGILRSGNKPYLIKPDIPSITAGILKTLNVKYILCRKAGTLEAEYIPMDSLVGGGLCPARFENEFALSTSATTLQEKICFYNGAAVAAQILCVKGILKKNKRMFAHHNGRLKQLAFLPFYHVFGLFAVFFWFTFFSRTLVFMREMSAESLLATCKRHEVTHIFAVPLVWHTIEKKVRKELAARPEAQQKKFNRGVKIGKLLQAISPIGGATATQKLLSEVTDKLFGQSVKFCISGGSALHRNACELINALGYPLHNGYGSSELGITSVELRAKSAERTLCSVGQPFDAVEYRLENGELFVKSRTRCARRMVEGKEIPWEEWFPTGDMMEQRPDGHYYICGRKGDVVIGENGENINPDLLEEQFELRDAAAFSILGLEDKLTMILEVSPYLPSSRARALWEQIAAVSDRLPDHSRIRAFYSTFDPLSAPGAIKVSRTALRRDLETGKIKLIPFAELLSRDTEELSSSLSDKVRALMARVLEVEEASITPDAHVMLELGADSMQYFSLLSALAEEFSLSAPDREENYCYTLRTICEYIERYI